MNGIVGRRLIAAFSLAIATTCQAKWDNPPPPIAAVGTPIVLGEWHKDIARAKALSDSSGIPMLVIYGDTSCSYCSKLNDQVISANFVNYRQSRKLYMIYGIDTGGAIRDFARNPSLDYPYVAVYWKGQTYKFTSRFSPVYPENGQAFINKVESYISAYVTPPDTPPETDAFDPADNTEATATRLAMTKTAQASAPHYLNNQDTADWFRFTNIVAGTEYRVSVSDFAQSNATSLTATFYRASSATPLTNMPLANLASAYTFTAATSSNILVKISRAANTAALVSYMLNYREWVPCTLSLVTNAVRVSEGLTQMQVQVRRSGDPAATSATLTFRNGSATAGEDYVATPVALNWTAGGSDVQTAVVPLINTDQRWEDNETFFIDLTPNPVTALSGQYLEQQVTILERTAPASGTIGYTAYGPGKTPLVSTTRIAVRENELVSLWLRRENGTVLQAAADFVWSDGSAAPADLIWAHLEDGEKEKVVQIPEQAGYQPVRSLTLDFTAAGATAAAGRTRATFTVTDSTFVSSLAAYVAQNPSIPFKTTGETWFQTQSNALRCVPPTALTSPAMTASLTGPGVLTFKGAKSGSGAFTITVGTRAAQNIVSDGSLQVVAIPAGLQAVTWRFARDAGSTDLSFGSIADAAYTRLPAVSPAAPVAGAFVREGMLTLRWADALAGVRAIPGLGREYKVFAGPSAGAMTQVGEAIPAKAGAAGALDLPPLGPVLSAVVNAAVGTLYWRVDMALNDGVNQVNVTGGTQRVTVVPSSAPAFDVKEAALVGQKWFEGLADGATLTAKMMAGVQVAIGPLPVDVPTGTPLVQVKSGALPGGLAFSVENGAVWLKGVPAKAGAGTALIQINSKAGFVTTAGTTVALVYTVDALPAGAFGTFNGGASRQDIDFGVSSKPFDENAAYGLASMTVASTGKTTGKFTFAGRTYTFSAAGYDSAEEQDVGPVYRITNNLAAVYGTNRVAITVSVAAAWPGRAYVRAAEAGQLPLIEADMTRNGWADKPLDAGRQEVLAACQGYYTLVLPDNDAEDGDAFGSGYLTLTVSSKGAVKASGRLADNTLASMSGSVLLDEAGNPYTVLFLAPRTYAGGFFFTRIAFALSEGAEPVTLSGYAVWRNNSAVATGVYGDGFLRVLEVMGGFYNKTQTLQNHYFGVTEFSASFDTWDSPILMGINTLGRNFTVPTAGSPDNPVYLRITANRVTGLFSGSLRDFGGAGSAYASRTYRGALTPTLVDEVLPVAGRGFFLERVTVRDPYYTYSLSHDFLITPDCSDCAE